MPERKRTACLTALCLLAALLAVLLPAFAADDEQPQRLATVNYSAGVNLREGPGTGYSSLRIPFTENCFTGRKRRKCFSFRYKYRCL